MSTESKKVEVLIIDDTPRNLQLVGNLLSQQDYKPVFATNGKQGISSALANPPSLILLDISMPEMDGFEVCEKLKNNNITKEIPIIFLTAHTETADVIKGFKIGAVDYVTKPFNNAELLQRVATHLELKNSKDTIRDQYDSLQIKNIELDKLNQLIADRADEIKTINEELKHSNESKDKLFSIIAHDLRGPIGGIKTMLGLLNDPEAISPNGFSPDITDTLLMAADKTWYLLENLLAWSRTERGILNINKTELILYSLVEDAIALLKSNQNKKQINIVNQLTENHIIVADENMTSTVIRNLISNAIKFTDIGGTITISGEISDNSVKISIADSGVGMPQEISSKLFSKNSFVSTHGTNNEKGSGLGLKICKEFIVLQNGTIGVVSSEGKGSTFWFKLPK